MIALLTSLFVSTNLKADSCYELYNGLRIAKKRIDRLKKEKALLEKERNELLNSYESSLERCIYLEDKIGKLADQLSKWIEKYEKLSKECERKGIEIVPYLKIGGSDKHFRGGLGLDIRLGKNFVFYGEAYGKYDRRNNIDEKGLFWEAGLKYEFR